jgi:hypothetical protein
MLHRRADDSTGRTDERRAEEARREHRADTGNEARRHRRDHLQAAARTGGPAHDATNGGADPRSFAVVGNNR